MCIREKSQYKKKSHANTNSFALVSICWHKTISVAVLSARTYLPPSHTVCVCLYN